MNLNCTNFIVVIKGKDSSITPRHEYSRRRSGFNLIEAAIVLAVTGLVIGGIWVAASKVAMDRKIDIAVTDLGMAVAKLDQYEAWQIGNPYSPLAQTGAKLQAFQLFDSTYSQIANGVFVSTKHDIAFDMSSAVGATYFKVRVTPPSRKVCTAMLPKMLTMVQQRPPTANTYANGLMIEESANTFYCPFVSATQWCFGSGITSIPATDVIGSVCHSFVISLGR